ncbi:MAG: leucine--tRNA ligase [Planctomycetes bacterium]|nr:leucine--tRNA ligase [Planctomycetota bacterium]
MTYDPSTIEPRWQAVWKNQGTFRTDTRSAKPKYYVLDMFPYPSGAGLHVGHVEGYTASDIVARHKRMQGFEVLHPMGWDAFGLPAEQYAIQMGVHPRESTKSNVDNFREQLQLLGFSYDWNREIGTYDPSFYHWTQWIFLKLMEKGLAYQTEMPVNWCPTLGTVLANDEVIDGKSERGGHPVVRRPMRQWMLKITEYADRLLEGLDTIDFPESIKSMQRDRIGRSEGADASFCVQGSEDRVEVFTTRPDTMFGATFCVLAPEHDLVARVTTKEQQAEVQAYVDAAARKSEIDRSGPEAGKSGVFTGAYAINPATNRPVPIWVADYVLMGYGTGAIMCVPGHDERDWAFAKKFDLPIIEVVQGGNVEEAAWSGEGPHVHSGFLDGMSKDAAIQAMNAWLEERSLGRSVVRYRLRDWVFARQRYWGEPIPVIHGPDGRYHPMPESELPLELPDVANYAPSGTGESPLASAGEWLQATVPGTGEEGRRETDTMPGSAGSSWYFLRFIDPDNGQTFCDPELSARWMPVDLYLGGAEHAVGHLLYSRFWTKFLYDLGLCSVEEPFARLVNQGMILGEDNRKMSKRYGNVVNPTDVVRDYGADALRVYEMFMGPIEAEKPWNTQGVDGIRRFLSRVWRLWFDEEGQVLPAVVDVAPADDELKILHRTIEKVAQDTDSLRFNTAIAQMMVFTNEMTKREQRSRAALEPFCLLLAPYAPHLAEEIWHRLGHEDTLAFEAFPVADPKWLVDDTIEVPVQINGKLRSILLLPAEVDQEAASEAAFADEKVAAQLEGKTVVKVVYVKGRLLNIVVR